MLQLEIQLEGKRWLRIDSAAEHSGSSLTGTTLTMYSMTNRVYLCCNAQCAMTCLSAEANLPPPLQALSPLQASMGSGQLWPFYKQQQLRQNSKKRVCMTP